MNETIAAIATAPGSAGITVVRISGDQAYEICNKVFKPVNKNKNVLQAKGYTAAFGHFYYNNEICDEAVALFFKAPKSYTGEDVVEISCHGGRAVSDNLLSACIMAGAKPAQAGEFTKRAFLSGRISLTQAEAVMDIINANTQAAANVAQKALDGSLYRKINDILVSLTKLAGHITAYIDYPEENVPDLQDEELSKTLVDAQSKLKILLDNYETGALLKRGVETAIVGSPNVGKSTLLNLLSGFERAIVTNIAGTTRDIVNQHVVIGGIEIFLSDTAGIRQTTDIVEEQGIKRSLECIKTAGLILCVFDSNREFDQTEKEIALQCQGKNAIAIINKIDLEQKIDIKEIEKYFKNIVYISAKNTESLKDIENAIKDTLNLMQIDTDMALLANKRQFDAAVGAYQAVTEAIFAQQSGITLDAIGVCVDDALYSLYQLTGENVSDSIIDEVFSTFCVGK